MPLPFIHSRRRQRDDVRACVRAPSAVVPKGVEMRMLNRAICRRPIAQVRPAQARLQLPANHQHHQPSPPFPRTPVPLQLPKMPTLRLGSIAPDFTVRTPSPTHPSRPCSLPRWPARQPAGSISPLVPGHPLLTPFRPLPPLPLLRPRRERTPSPSSSGARARADADCPSAALSSLAQHGRQDHLLRVGQGLLCVPRPLFSPNRDRSLTRPCWPSFPRDHPLLPPRCVVARASEPTRAAMS